MSSPEFFLESFVLVYFISIISPFVSDSLGVCSVIPENLFESFLRLCEFYLLFYITFLKGFQGVAPENF